MFNQSKAEFKVVEFRMREVFGARDQLCPQFKLNFTPALHAQVMEMAGNITNLSKITATDIAKLSGSDFGYGRPVPAREIPGGWDAKRVVFVLHLTMAGPTDVTLGFVIGGYTNQLPEKTEAGMNWDSVTFHVNSITVQHHYTMMTPEEKIDVKRIVSVDHVLTDTQYTGVHKSHYSKFRPTDVFNTMEVGTLWASMGEVSDTRTLMTSVAALSDRAHAIPSVWLAKIFRSHMEATASRSHGDDGDMIRHNARAIAGDRQASSDAFLRTIGTIAGHPVSSVFTLRDIKQLDGEFRKATTYVELSAQSSSAVLSEKHLPEEQREKVAAGDEVVQHATLLVGTAATALAAQLGITTINFYVDNTRQDLDRFTATAINTMNSEYGPVVDEAILNEFKLRFLNQVLPTVDYNGQAICQFSVRVHVYGESKVYWKIDEEKVYRRTIASYADALMTPVVMAFDPKSKTEEQPQVVMATDIENLLNDLDVAGIP